MLDTRISARPRFIPRYDRSVVYSQLFRELPEKCFEALVNMESSKFL